MTDALKQLMKPESVSGRFGCAFVGVVSLILFLYAGTEIFIDNSNINKALENKMLRTLHLSKVSLATPLWNLDNHIVDDFIEALFLDESMVFAEVIWGNKVISKRVRKEYTSMEFSFLRESPLFISMFSDILYEGNKAGTVRLAMSRETVKQELIYGILQTVFLTVFMIVAITVTSLIITRKYITTPLLKLQESASSIAKGNLDTLIDKSSNDEIGVLAQQFDKMRESVKTLFLEVSENKSKIEEYSRTLEQKVDQRTVELEQSVDELQALGEVSRVVNSTLDLNMVLTSIMHHAVQLSNTKGGTIFEFEESEQVFVPKTYYGISNRLTQKIKRSVLRIGDKTALGQAGLQKAPVQISDLTNEPDYPLPYVLEDGFCALLAIPLIHENRLIGGLVVLRENAGNFAGRTVELLQMFAAQSALAMYNAQLFTQVEEKSSQLELADKHKSEFLANMSHELRTPLNAILGYTDLILDEIYGDVPEKIGNVLVRVEKNGRHLLNLINDILDISKIEAGRLTLSLDDYSFGELVNTVLVSVEGLAAEKGLELAATVDNDLPVGRADQQRIAQVLVNLLGNAIKFTDEGEVEIVVGTRNNSFLVSVLDTGVGLSAEDRKIVFEGFRQVDGSSTRERGGTGLGLAIVKKIVEMHGGRIWVESRSEGGANFSFSIPVRVEQQVGPQWEN
jgi:signal transduction histidine kinase/HAMP domain-containing protein